jgi:hypothetical protein
MARTTRFEASCPAILRIRAERGGLRCLSSLFAPPSPSNSPHRVPTSAFMDEMDATTIDTFQMIATDLFRLASATWAAGRRRLSVKLVDDGSTVLERLAERAPASFATTCKS